MITKAYRLVQFNRRDVLLCLLCGKYTITPANIDRHYCGYCHLDLDEVTRLYDPGEDWPEVHVEPLEPLSTRLPWVEQRIHSPLLTSERLLVPHLRQPLPPEEG